jgi:hypothetical protein
MTERDRLHQHARHYAVWRPLHQFQGKASADTVAHEKELLDSEMVHQSQLVVGECVPWVSGGDWAGKLAAVRVALIHCDATELVLEYLHRVENRIGPVAYARVQAAAGDEEKRKAAPGFLITDPDISLLILRHGSLSGTGWQTSCHHR